MPPRKKNAFRSIRIIGEKAQNILQKAKSNAQKQESQEKTARVKTKQRQEMVVYLSIPSIMRAAFSILAILLGAWLLFHLRQKILLLLLAAFLATVIDPGVQRLQRWGVSRGIAVIVHYFFAVFLLLFLIFSLVPIIALQLQQIGQGIAAELGPFMNNPEISLPFIPSDSPVNQQVSRTLKTAMQNMSIDTFTSQLVQTGENLSDVAQESVRFAARVAGSVVNFVVSFVIVLVLAFFFQLEKERIVRWVRSFLPLKLRPYADRKSEAIHSKIGQWMRGELLLMLSIFLLSFLALKFLGMDYALTLAVLAGFCELIPAVGPLFAAIPAILIAGTQKGIIWIPIIAGVYYVIQWCENNLLVPLIMKRAVGLSPIAILFAMMVGISFPDTIHPILGVMLAVPTTTIIALFLEDWRES